MDDFLLGLVMGILSLGGFFFSIDIMELQRNRADNVELAISKCEANLPRDEKCIGVFTVEIAK